jgi:hypothetical protein
MTAIPVNKMLAADEVTINKLDLATDSATHSFSFVNHKQALVVENGEVGSVTVNVLGDGVTVADCDGLDAISLAAGYDFVIPAGVTKTLFTTKRKQYLGDDGNNIVVTVTGAVSAAFGWLSETN